jgi:hypothetical protein
MKDIVQDYIAALNSKFASPLRFDSHLVVQHVFRHHSGEWQALVVSRGSVALAHGYIAQVIGQCGATKTGEIISLSVFGEPEVNALWEV